MPKRYELAAEVSRVAKKHPDFELALPNVAWPADEPREEGGPEHRYERRIVTVPPMERLPDDVLVLSSTNPVASARALLGTEAYDHFVAAGGSATLFWQIMQENSGASTGESSPSDAS